MAAPAGFAWSFRNVFVHSTDRVAFIAGHDESDEKELPVTFIFRWAGKWASKQIPTAMIGTGLCTVEVPEPTVLAMGINGIVATWNSRGFATEIIDDSVDGPQNLGDLQEIRLIGGRPYVVGMRRTAYRRVAPGRWERIDQSLRCLPGDKSNAGLTSIHGLSESSIFAVGWGGEIWRYDGKDWTQIESPTNVGLFRVVCGGDGNVYACGQRGVVLRGSGNQWEVLEQDVTKDDLWGATWFQGRLFVSSANGIFVVNGDALDPVEIKSDKKLKFAKKASFYRLDANEEVLWSAGLKMLLYTRDAISWTETPYS